MENMKTRVYSVAHIDSKLKSGFIRDDHPLQRMSEQHSNTIRDNIIASAIADRYIPEVIICEQRIKGTDDAIMWLIDGKQRWTELAMFRRNQIKLGRNIEDPIIRYRKAESTIDNVVYGEFDIRGKRYADLPSELKEQYDAFEIQGRIFLDCKKEDIERYIRKFNNFKAMTSAQRGITHIGSEYASVAKRLAAHDFFKDGIGKFSYKEMRNGSVERVIIDSVMLMSFPDAWQKSHEKTCDYLRENGTIASFEKLEKYIERLENVLIEGTVDDYFNCKNAHLYFALFDKFQSLGKNDDDFALFLSALKGMTDVKVDGISLAEFRETFKNTKDKSYVHRALNILETLMYQFFNMEKKEQERVECHESRFEGLVNALKTSSVSEYAERPEDVIGNYLAIKYQKDPGTSLKDFLSSFVIPTDERDDLELCLDILTDWTIEIDGSNPVLQNGNISALLAVVNYTLDEVPDKVAREWFINFASNVRAGDFRFSVDQEENYKGMLGKLERFAQFKKSA